MYIRSRPGVLPSLAPVLAPVLFLVAATAASRTLAIFSAPQGNASTVVLRYQSKMDTPRGDTGVLFAIFVDQHEAASNPLPRETVCKEYLDRGQILNRTVRFLPTESRLIETCNGVDTVYGPVTTAGISAALHGKPIYRSLSGAVRCTALQHKKPTK